MFLPQPVEQGQDMDRAWPLGVGGAAGLLEHPGVDDVGQNLGLAWLAASIQKSPWMR
jgi:hypothetical protein